MTLCLSEIDDSQALVRRIKIKLPTSDEIAAAIGSWISPNALTWFRLVGSFALIPLALMGFNLAFALLYAILMATDLIDGWLARHMHVESSIGAQLDSYADVILTGCLLFGLVFLCGETIRDEVWWIAAAVISYVASMFVCYARFGRIPAYHTYLAKSTQALASLAAICLLLGISVWPLRIVAGLAVLTNIESIAISSLLKSWQSDVRTVFKVFDPKESKD